ERLHQQLDEARAAGEISSAIHAGFKAKSSREVGLDSPGVRGEPEPQRPQREAASAASAKVAPAEDGGGNHPRAGFVLRLPFATLARHSRLLLAALHVTFPSL